MNSKTSLTVEGNMKRIGTIILALFFFIILAHGEAENAELADLTIMIYMNGSNLETLQGQATKDIDEMLSSGYDPSRIHIVLYTGGCRKWKTGFSSDQNGLYLLDPISNEATCVELSDRSSMGSQDTLNGFLNKAYTLFPAEKYALILWDHGAGPLGGVCFDELSAGDSLLLPEIGTALENSPFNAENKLSFIGFDACLMACAETASLCAPYAEYMIASEEPEPGSGWNYGFVGRLTGTESGEDVGKQVIDCFREGLQVELEKGKPLTLTEIDLNMTDALNQALDRLFTVMKGDFDTIGYNAISRGRDSMRSIARTTGSEYDLVDLRDMAEHYAEYAPDESAEVLSVLDQMTLYHFSTVHGDHGLSTYYPYYNKTQYREKKNEFNAVNPCITYRDYISLFSENWLTGRSGIWKGLVPYQEEGGYALELTPEQMEEFAYARFTVAEDLTIRDDEQYSFIYRTNDVSLDGSGILYAEWDNKALFCMNSRGRLLADKSLIYSSVDDMILVPVRLNKGDDFETFMAGGDIKDNHLSASMRFRREADDSLTLIDVLDTSDQSLKQMTQLEVDLGEWDKIEFFYQPRHPSYDDDGMIKPFSDWDQSSWIMTNSVEIGGDWHLCFTDRFLNSSERIAVFSLYDVYGNAYGSEILRISNPNIVTLSTERKDLLSSDRVTVSLSKIEQHTLPENAYVLRFTASNLSDEEIELRITDPVINERYTLNPDGFSTYLGELLPGETADLSFTVSRYDMDWLPPVSVDTLRFTLSEGDHQVTCLTEIPGDENTVVGSPAYDEDDLTVFRVTDDVFFKVKSRELLPDQTDLIFLRGILVNESEQPYSLETGFNFCDVYLNGKYLYDAGSVRAGDVQPHTETLAEISIRAERNILFTGSDKPSDNAFANLYDLSRIDTLILKNNTSDGQEDICLRFPEPMDLSHGVQPTSVMLAGTDDVSVELLQAKIVQDQLDFVIRIATADEPITVDPENGIWSDGTEVYIMSDNRWPNASILTNAIPTDPGTETIVVLSADLPADGIQPDTTLEFTLTLKNDRDTSRTVYADNICLGFSEQACTDLRDGKRVPADSLVIRPGVMNHIDANRQYIVKEIEILGDPSSAVRKLEIPIDRLEKDQIENIKVFLIKKDYDEKYGDLWLPVYRKVLKDANDKAIDTEISGLLLSSANDEEAVLFIDEQEGAQGPDFYTVSKMYFSDGNFPVTDGATLKSRQKITLDPDSDTAFFEDLVFDIPPDPELIYTEIITIYYDFIAEKESDGRYPYITDMQIPPIIIGEAMDISRTDLKMVLRPIVPEDEIYIVYSFIMKDGTRFSLEPIAW